MLAHRVVDPDLLVTHTFLLGDFETAFQTLIDEDQSAVKVVLVP
jgi:threonine dehydrogenase-like Zn-dependent dehydrogenase